MAARYAACSAPASPRDFPAAFWRFAMLLGVLLLLGANEAQATYAESPVFAFDTRDDNAAHYAESALFAVDTRDANATHYGESAMFAFDTRAIDGLNGSRTSGNFVLDTRNATASGLMIVGPSSVTSGSQTEYRVVMNHPGGGTTDVTNPALLGFVGPAPAWAGIGGTTLFVLRDAAAGASAQLQASYQNNAGQVLSPPLTVTVTAGFFAGMSIAPPQHTGGGNHEITLEGRVTGGTAPFTYRWDTDADGNYDDLTGTPRTFTKNSAAGGTFKIKLEVTDATGAKAYAHSDVTLNKAPVANEPPQRTPPRDPANGHLFGHGGQPLVMTSAGAANGFVLVTHGIYTDPLDSESWSVKMGGRVASRLAEDPNIAIYDWSHLTDPGGKVDPIKLMLLDQLGRYFRLPRLGLAGTAADFVIDAWFIRNEYPAMLGQDLATWMIAQAEAGLIDPDKPVHLIGHSAGGFVVGECAMRLRQHAIANGPHTGKRIIVDRLTMLDTPFPMRPHLTQLLNPTVVERYVSSYYGGLEAKTFFLFENAYRRLDYLGTWWPFNFFIDGRGHGLAHRWYARTILPIPGEPDATQLDGFDVDGFLRSPLVTGLPSPRPWQPGGALLASNSEREKAALFAGPALAAGLLSDFMTFGAVSEAAGVYTITEQASAGITKTVTVPIGAYAVRFRFKFAASGDGDFLSFSFGEDLHLFTGLDDMLSRRDFTEIEAPLEGLDGQTGALTFKLVSRGIPNAIVEVADIEFLVDVDPDGDGITTDQELTLGTDPLLADSDADGLSDPVEVGTAGTDPVIADTDSDGLTDGAEVQAGTNPLDGASLFAVVAAQRSPTGFLLQWPGRAGRSYRVQRAETPEFSSFTTVASDLPATEPMMTFIDTTVSPLATEAFYRVLVQ